MRLARIAAATAILAAGTGAFLVIPAGATHDGETITVSRFDGLADGDVVDVTFAKFTPTSAGGKPVKVVIAGQKEFTTVPDKLNFAEYGAAPKLDVAADGTGKTTFTVKKDHGTDNNGAPFVCGQTGPCYIVAIQEPFMPIPRWAVQEITFGGSGAPVTAAPAATTTTEVVATTTTEAATTTTTVKAAVMTEAPKDSTVKEESSNTGLIIGGIAAAVVVLGGIGFALSRKSRGDDGAPPAPMSQEPPSAR